MSDNLYTAINALQGGDEASVQKAFGEIVNLTRRQPEECASALSDALLEEIAAGKLHTPRLLTLLGLTHEPAPKCVPICLNFLREFATTASLLPNDAVIGAAAVVARTEPRALLPDLSAIETGSRVAQGIDRGTAQALPLLFAISSKFLGEIPDSAFSDMVRWLWYDCALFDLMTMVDFASFQVERSDEDDPIVGLLVDLIERVPATEDQKQYAGRCLQEAGVGDAVIKQIQSAWRAIRVAPLPELTTLEPPAIVDPEPPLPEARIDTWLAEFAEGDVTGIKLARAYLYQMFETTPLPKALAWWVAVTVDSLPPWRRRRDIDWALVQIVTAMRRHGEHITILPPSLLQRWLDTPQLLNSGSTQIALDLLSRQQPRLIVQHYLHRAVVATGEHHPEIIMGGLWRALATAEPAAILAIASRWVAFGFDRSDFLELLIKVLIDGIYNRPALIHELDDNLSQASDMPNHVIDVARELLDKLREDLQP